MRSATFAALGVTVTIGAFGCPSLSSFTCDDDAQCARAAHGVCLGNDCAYPDPECGVTMLRWSPNADGKGGECVSLMPSDTSGTSTSASSSSGGIASCGTTRTVALETSLLGATSLPGYPAL